MRCKVYIPLGVEDVVNMIRKSLQDDGFIVTEDEATFVVKIREGKAEKVKDWSRFWCRKGPLGGKYRPDYSLVIQGEVRTEEEGSVVDMELIEYHASRPHTYGGSSSIPEYFEKLCKIFEDRPVPTK